MMQHKCSKDSADPAAALALADLAHCIRDGWNSPFWYERAPDGLLLAKQEFYEQLADKIVSLVLSDPAHGKTALVDFLPFIERAPTMRAHIGM